MEAAPTRIFENREVPKFFSEQNAVILNDLYAVAPGETVEFDVYVKQVNENTIANLAELLTVKVSSESNPSNFVSLAVAGVTPPTEVTLDETTLSLVTGGTRQLTATVTPWNAQNKDVTWSSDNDDVATVTGSGTSAEVRAISAGTAVITVTAADGGHTASCTVTVTNPPADDDDDDDDDDDTPPPSGGGTTPPPSGGGTDEPGQEPDIEITLPGGGTITVPPSAEVDTGTGNATLPNGGEVTLPGGGTFIVPPSTTVDADTGTVTIPGGAVTLPGLASPFVVPPATTIDPSTGVMTTTEGGSITLPNNMGFTVPPGTTIDPTTGTVTTTERGVFVIPDAPAAPGGASDSLEFILPVGSTINPNNGSIRLPGGTLILPGPNGVIDTPQGATALDADKSKAAAENDDIELDIPQVAYVGPTTGEVTIPTAGTITTPAGPVEVKAGAIINPYTGEITYSGTDEEPGKPDSSDSGGGGGCDVGATGLFVLSMFVLALTQGEFGKKRR
jgi:hypothetical protein